MGGETNKATSGKATRSTRSRSIVSAFISSWMRMAKDGAQSSATSIGCGASS